MFKFLRQYQGWILAVGVTLLMLVFLVEIPLSTATRGDAGSSVIGTLKGEKIRISEKRDADIDLSVLRSISPLLARRESGDSAFQWLLMVREARALGLDTSREQIEQLKRTLLGEESQQRRFANQTGANMPAIDRALRHWGMVQQLQELVLGLGHQSPTERLSLYGEAMQFAQMGFTPGAVMALESAQGKGRVSEPLLLHSVQEQQATVEIAAVAVGAERYLAQVKSVPDAELQSLFDKYREKLPGEPDEMGRTLGYKTPDRVRLEYLAVPFDRIRAQVEIDEADVLTYFDEHKAEFRPTPEPGATQPAAAADPVAPDEQARLRIIERLKDERATDLANRIIKAAQAQLNEATRTIKETGGYREFPQGFTPVALDAVARQIQKQFGILPDVRREDSRWLDAGDLAALPGIGRSAANGRPGEAFTAYVLSARELQPKNDNPLIALRLQVGMHSVPTVGMEGSRYIFRLIKAEPARIPANLDEVREQVLADARRLAAYELLLKDLPRWSSRLQSESLASIAKEIGRPLLTPAPFRRRDLAAGAQAPVVEGVGRDGRFVDEVFDIAQGAFARGPIETLPPAQRSRAIPSIANLAVYLVRVESYRPITRRDYERMATNPLMVNSVQQLIAPIDRQSDPFSTDALVKRLGYVHARDEQPGEEPGQKTGEKNAGKPAQTAATTQPVKG